MRLIPITLAACALAASGLADDPPQKQADAGKRLVVGEAPLAAALTGPTLADVEENVFVPDLAKGVMLVETPLKEMLEEHEVFLAEPVGSPVFPGLDALPAWGPPPEATLFQPISKGRIEQPLKRMIGPVALREPDAPVPAGLVEWHADLTVALAASRTSGKPVLLFQLLGRLDEAFC